MRCQGCGQCTPILQCRAIRLAMEIPANGSPADAVPTVAGSHMTLFRPTPPRIPGARGSSAPGEVSKSKLKSYLPNVYLGIHQRCEHCGKNEDLGNLLICESCDHSYHMNCLDPQVA